MFCSAKLGGKPQEAIQVVAFFPKVSFVEENCFCYCVSLQFNMMFNFGVKMKKKRDFLPASSLEFISMSTRLDRLV